MKRLMCVMMLTLVGCVSVNREPVNRYGDWNEKRKNLTAIDQVHIGMDDTQVRELMKDKLVIGYHRVGMSAAEELTLPQPYKTTRLVTDSGTYDIHFYITKIHKADGIISQEELTPVIFLEHKLVGIGSEALEGLGVN